MRSVYFESPLNRNETSEIVEIVKKVKSVKIPIAKKNKTIQNSSKNVSKEKFSEKKSLQKEPEVHTV